MKATTLVLTDVLHALCDPVRLDIVVQLASEGETACGTFGIEMPKSSLSHHFKVLREAGVIETRKDGVRSLNTLRSDALEAAFPGVLESILAAAQRRARRRK